MKTSWFYLCSWWMGYWTQYEFGTFSRYFCNMQFTYWDFFDSVCCRCCELSQFLALLQLWAQTVCCEVKLLLRQKLIPWSQIKKEFLEWKKCLKVDTSLYIAKLSRITHRVFHSKWRFFTTYPVAKTGSLQEATQQRCSKCQLKKGDCLEKGEVKEISPRIAEEQQRRRIEIWTSYMHEKIHRNIKVLFYLCPFQIIDANEQHLHAD